jgi:CRP-like cAMP-binding protein
LPPAEKSPDPDYFQLHDITLVCRPFPEPPLTDTISLPLAFARGLAAIPEIRDAGVPRTAKKGEQIFRDDDASRLFIVQHGLIKLAFITPDGKEWIRSFVAAPGVFGQRFLRAPEEVGAFAAICLEPCTLVAYPYELLERVGGRDIELTRMGFELVRYYSLQRERRARNMLSLSAEESYRDFMAEHPEVAARISQADTARYLGITPVALSRIRSRMDL